MSGSVVTYIKDIIGYSGSFYKSDTDLPHVDSSSLFICCQSKLYSERFVLREQKEISIEIFFMLYFEVLVKTSHAVLMAKCS